MRVLALLVALAAATVAARPGQPAAALSGDLQRRWWPTRPSASALRAPVDSDPESDVEAESLASESETSTTSLDQHQQPDLPSAADAFADSLAARLRGAFMQKKPARHRRKLGRAPFSVGRHRQSSPSPSSSFSSSSDASFSESVTSSTTSSSGDSLTRAARASIDRALERANRRLAYAAMSIDRHVKSRRMRRRERKSERRVDGAKEEPDDDGEQRLVARLEALMAEVEDVLEEMRVRHPEQYAAIAGLEETRPPQPPTTPPTHTKNIGVRALEWMLFAE